MAPTEILANQHHLTFKTLFLRKLGLMTSARKENIEAAKIFIGTHALNTKMLLCKLGLLL